MQVFPEWEDCAKKFERHGAALSYVEFEDLCMNEISLSKAQVRAGRVLGFGCRVWGVLVG